ncbi:MAG: hypothetical protein LBC42_00855 [Puniceicoccales bacterium]|jgi:hypothetical protein|nr:hypothetical protein [Puniceicoccales bacterium]
MDVAQLFALFTEVNPYHFLGQFFLGSDMASPNVDHYQLVGDVSDYVADQLEYQSEYPLEDQLNRYSPKAGGGYIVDPNGDFVRRIVKDEVHNTVVMETYMHISRLFTLKNQHISTISRVLALSYQASRIQIATLNAYISDLEESNASLSLLQECYRDVSILLGSFEEKDKNNMYATMYTRQGFVSDLVKVGAVAKTHIFCTGVNMEMVKELLHTVYLFGNDTSDDAGDIHGAWTWQAVAPALTQYGVRIARILAETDPYANWRINRDTVKDDGAVVSGATAVSVDVRETVIHLPVVHCTSGNFAYREYKNYTGDSQIFTDYEDIRATSITRNLQEADFVNWFLSTPEMSPPITFKCHGISPGWSEDGWELKKCVLTSASTRKEGNNEIKITRTNYPNIRQADNEDGTTIYNAYNYGACKIYKKAIDVIASDRVYVSRMELSTFSDDIRRRIDQMSKEQEVPVNYVNLATGNMEVVYTLAMNLIQAASNALQQTAGNTR